MPFAIESRATLLDILDTAIAADNADKGNVQLFNPHLDALEIIAQRGFGELFLQTFRLVTADTPSVCARALRFKRRVAVSDVHHDPFFWPYVPLADKAGFRAVQSTPIFAGDGSVKGILSTHFAQPHRLTHQGGKILDRCAAQLAKVLQEDF